MDEGNTPEKQVDIEPLPEKSRSKYKTNETHVKTPERIEGYKKWQKAGQLTRQENKAKLAKYNEMEQKVKEYESLFSLLRQQTQKSMEPLLEAESQSNAGQSPPSDNLLNKYFGKYKR